MTRSTLTADEFDTQIARFVQSTKPGSRERAVAASAAVNTLVRSGAVRNWTRTLTPPSHTSTLVDHDEIGQIIVERLLVHLNTVNAGQAQRVTSWAGWCWWKAKQAVRDTLQSSSYTVASGMATLLRRYARVQSATEVARDKLGRTPTVDEVIAVANEGRADRARRDGTFVSRRDFEMHHVPHSINELSEARDGEDLSAAYLPDTPDIAEDVAARDAADRLANRLIGIVNERCRDTDVAVIGRLWSATVVAGSTLTVKQVVDITGWTRSRASAALVAWSSTVTQLREEGKLDQFRR